MAQSLIEQLHEIVGALLDGAVQIKTRRKWKWLKGPRKRPRRAVNAKKAPALPVPKVKVPTRPHGHEIIVWTNKYRVLKQCAAMPQKRGVFVGSIFDRPSQGR
jgi:hypothetical protein